MLLIILVHFKFLSLDCIILIKERALLSIIIQIEIEKEKRISKLRDLMECCSKNITFPKDMCVLLDDHRDRRKDFFLASANFKNLLENSRLSVSQMEKLQRQHDRILKDFQQSRLLLDKELPKIINLYLFYFNYSYLYN